VLAVYGGQDVIAQMHKLQGKVHLVVGTPGRILDHIRRETIDFSEVSTFVLDEADQMLHIGFLDDIEDIMDQVPETRQTLLFSATMPDEVRKLAETYTKNPKDVQIKTKQITLKEIRQRVVQTTDRGKQNDLVRSIQLLRPYLAIIFCRTKRRVSKLNEALQTMGYNSDELHGDLSQAKREDVMKRFRDGEIQFLVATDVAARGLDVEGVTHVFNYDIALDSESYIHRIGRTGRAGGKGLAVTFVAPKDRRLLQLIERDTEQTLRTLELDMF
jgi:ATP-dependent RNA helicase DeaD